MMDELEWDEFFPNFFAAHILDVRLFVNWSTPFQNWEFVVEDKVVFRNSDPMLVFAQAQSWANQYYRKNVRLKE